MILDNYRSPWLNEDLNELAQLTRKFLQKESVPHHARWAGQHEIDRDFWNKAGDAGLLCLSIPEEFGGGGGTVDRIRSAKHPHPRRA